MIRVAAACLLGGVHAFTPSSILSVQSRAAQRRATLVTAASEKMEDTAAKLEALRAQVAAARQAAKESDYEWYLENAALLEGSEEVASSLDGSRVTGAAQAPAPAQVASPVAPPIAAPVATVTALTNTEAQATTWDLTGSEVQASELTSVEAAAYRQYQAASSNIETVNDAVWTADEADDVDPEFLSYDLGTDVEPAPEESRVKDVEAAQEDDRIASTLASLGYSDEEAASLVPDAVTMIVDLGFRRPQTARLPADWTKSEPVPGTKRQNPREASKSRSPETQAPPVRRRPSLSSPWVEDDEDDDVEDDKRAGRSAASQRSGFLQNPYAVGSSNKYDGDNYEDDEDYEGDYLYSDDDDDDMSLYPSMDKFKDMLRAESNLRLTVAGPWIRDFVVTENRVRLALYKWWLKSLDEGIGEAPQWDRDLIAQWDAIDAEEEARVRAQKALKAREEAEFEARRKSRARNRRRRSASRYDDEVDDDWYDNRFDDYSDDDRFRDEGPSSRPQYRWRSAPPDERQPSRVAPRRRPPRSELQSERRLRESSPSRLRRGPLDNDESDGYTREGDDDY